MKFPRSNNEKEFARIYGLIIETGYNNPDTINTHQEQAALSTIINDICGSTPIVILQDFFYFQTA
jgi:hypothetical protein